MYFMIYILYLYVLCVCVCVPGAYIVGRISVYENSEILIKQNLTPNWGTPHSTIRVMCPFFLESNSIASTVVYGSEGDTDRRENQYAAHHKSSYINVNYLIIYSVECSSYQRPFSVAVWVCVCVCMCFSYRFTLNIIYLSCCRWAPITWFHHHHSPLSLFIVFVIPFSTQAHTHHHTYSPTAAPPPYPILHRKTYRHCDAARKSDFNFSFSLWPSLSLSRPTKILKIFSFYRKTVCME